MPPFNKRCILKYSNAALIRKFTRKRRRLLEESFKNSYFTSVVYSFTRLDQNTSGHTFGISYEDWYAREISRFVCNI